MADFAPTFTPRYIVTYRNAGYTHDFLVRGARDETSTATINRGQTVARVFFDAMKGKLADDLTFIKAVYIPQDSNLSGPAPVPVPVTGSNALNLFKKKHRVMAMRFSGKTSGRSKAAVNVFGILLDAGDDTNPDPEDYIVTAAEDTDVDAAITALNGANVPGVDGTTITFYSQATIKQHDHYVKRVRRGT